MARHTTRTLHDVKNSLAFSSSGPPWVFHSFSTNLNVQLNTLTRNYFLSTLGNKALEYSDTEEDLPISSIYWVSKHDKSKFKVDLCNSKMFVLTANTLKHSCTGVYRTLEAPRLVHAEYLAPASLVMSFPVILRHCCSHTISEYVSFPPIGYI